MKDYIFFWGCTIPGRFPFLEKSLRTVLSELGVRYREIDGFTCCPEQFLIETMSEETWYLTAARNLALAEREGCDLLVACNGCYSTFRSAISAFHSSSELREKVSGKLAEIGLDYGFRNNVKHVIELLHDDIGPEVLQRKITRRLNGIRLGVHYGCQLLRPTPTARIDDPERLLKLDRLVECLGAVNLEYNTRLNCCGESLGRSGRPEESLDTARLKLMELDQLGADALVVVCPACFLQFDTQQKKLQKLGQELSLPVFYYTELLALALGVDPGEIGLDMHRAEVEGFFERWEELSAMRSRVPDVFDYDAIQTCVKCESCMNDCPVTQVDEAFHPHESLVRVLYGQIDELLEGQDIWKCMECGTCVDLCPNSFGMMKVFKQAKRMAIERGAAPPETLQGIEMFEKTGILGTTRERARTRLGLGEVAKPDREQLARLLGLNEEGSEN